jgi:WD40 repeat protein
MDVLLWIVMGTLGLAFAAACGHAQLSRRWRKTNAGVRPLTYYERVLALLPPLLVVAVGLLVARWHVYRHQVRQFDHPAAVLCVAFGPTGERFVSGDADGAVRVWETDTGRLVGAYQKGPDGVTCVALSPDNRHVVAGNQKGRVRVWAVGQEDVPLWEPAPPKPPGPKDNDVFPPSRVVGVAFLPGGSRLLVAWEDRLAVYDLKSRRPTVSFEEPCRDIGCLALSPQGDRLLTGPIDQLWDVTTGKVVGGHPAGRVWLGAAAIAFDLRFGLGDVLLAVAISPDGRSFAAGRHFEASSQHGSTVRSDSVVLFHLPSLERARSLEQKQGGRVSALAFTPDGQGVLAGTQKGVLSVLDLQSSEPGPWFGAHVTWQGFGGVTALAVHPRENLALSAGTDRRVRLWRLP